MALDVVKISISDETVTFLRIPRGLENTFCTGFSETYTLSEQVKIEIEVKENFQKENYQKQNHEELIQDLWDLRGGFQGEFSNEYALEKASDIAFHAINVIKNMKEEILQLQLALLEKK